MVRFSEFLKDKVDISQEGYELKFLGKNYAKMIASLDTETVIVPDDIHNNQPENAKSKNVYISGDKEKGIPADHINEYSAANIVNAFVDWRIEKLQTRFRYSRSNQPVMETALTYKDGSPREVIKQGKVGTMFVEGTPSDKYLYNHIAFDSPLEKENIMHSEIDEIVVYGKIPKSSIAIPTIVGETYSPDFMYVVERKDGTKELNIVVETKLVEKSPLYVERKKLKLNVQKLSSGNLRLMVTQFLFTRS